MRANLARRLWQAMTSPDSGATSGDRARLPGGRDLALDMARLAARHGVSDHLQQDTSSAATRVAILVDRAREQRQTAADADTLAALTRALDVIVLKGPVTQATPHASRCAPIGRPRRPRRERSARPSRRRPSPAWDTRSPRSGSRVPSMQRTITTLLHG